MRSRPALLYALSALLSACDLAAPPENPAVGSYTATWFQTTTGGVVRDELSAGSTLDLSLNGDGTTSGHLHIVAASGRPALDADMAGTWTLSPQTSTIDISQNADTFVRDMSFRLVGGAADVWELVGDQVFSDTRIEIVLNKR